MYNSLAHNGGQRHFANAAGAVKWLLVAIFTCLGQVGAADIHVTMFAAASLKNAIDEVVSHYEDQEAIVVAVSFAGSSALARQIQNGAPADIFVSANTAWMDTLQNEDLIDRASRQSLLSNRLVLIAPTGRALNVGLDRPDSVVGALAGERLALALVNAVPAGIYAQEALRKLGLWDDLQTHLAQTSNVRAALRLVSIGEAPLGIVYATDAKADTNVEIVDRISPELHGDIIYSSAILNGSRAPHVDAFYRFLTGSIAADIFQNHGFLIPGRHDE